VTILPSTQNVNFSENSQEEMTKLHDGRQLRQSDFRFSFVGVQELQRTKYTPKEPEPLFCTVL